MSFLKIRQVTLNGERKTFINASAIAYIQELNPDQEPTWQITEEPSRTLIFLHQKLEPIISYDSIANIAKQVKGFVPDTGDAIKASAKRVR